MSEETKVPEVPVVEIPKPETTADESLIESRRSQIESLVIAENETIPELEAPEEVAKEEPKKEEPKVEDDPIKKIKESVQKRIDKVVAKQKSAEEKLAEAEAEIERLRAERLNPKTPDATTPKDDTPPTPDQVEAYIAKMSEEGNHKEVAAATRYLIKLEKEIALKEVQETQTKAQKEAETQKASQLKDWTDLSMDYEDSNPDMNLANQEGTLYKTALALYNDKELHANHYNDPNVIRGFRRAVADAYREIHQQGLVKTPKGETIIQEKRTPRLSLADPSAVETEEVPSHANSSLSDAEKVREEIKARNKNRFNR